MKCEYGCGNEAKYFLKRAKKWCCSKSYNSCPVARNKNRLANLGEKNHNYGKKCLENTKLKISKANKNNIPWNKNKKNIYSQETINKMKESMKGRIPWNKGKTFSNDTKKKISSSLKGNVPWNKGRKRSLETKKKISIANTGKKRSLKTIINHKEKIKGIKNPNWKGGYHKSGIPLFEVYYDKLTIEENPKRDIFDRNILTVVCANSGCDSRFIPKLSEVVERIRCLKGTQNGECRIYCSEECKNSCSIFRKVKFQKKHPLINEKVYTESEYNQFREFVLERDNYKCQYCGEVAEHVHHEKPQKLEPFFSLDPDYAWSCCKKCHYKNGHKDECSTGMLSKKIC